MFEVDDNIETKPGIWRSEIRVETPRANAMKKLLKHFKNPRPRSKLAIDKFKLWRIRNESIL